MASPRCHPVFKTTLSQASEPMGITMFDPTEKDIATVSLTASVIVITFNIICLTRSFQSFQSSSFNIHQTTNHQIRNTILVYFSSASIWSLTEIIFNIIWFISIENNTYALQAAYAVSYGVSVIINQNTCDYSRGSISCIVGYIYDHDFCNKQ